MHEFMKQFQPLSTFEKPAVRMRAEIRAEIDRRIAAHRADPGEGVSLDEIVRGLGVRL